MQVLITRGQPQGEQTAQAVAQLGCEPIVWPLFEIMDTGVALPSNTHFDGVIFTSANAAKILQARSWNASRKGPKQDQKHGMSAWCVGEKTAKAAENLGFAIVHSANGNASDLAELINGTIGNESANLLYPAAKQRAFDMEAAFGGTNIKVMLTEIYENKPFTPAQNTINAIMGRITDCLLLGYSEKSIHHTMATLDLAKPKTVIKNISLLAISQKVADCVLQYPWADVYVASEPSEAGILKKISDLTLRNV